MVALPSLDLLEDVAVGARVLLELRSYLRRPLSVEQALATLRRRLERREADLLALVRGAIYSHRASPYAELLARAGCEYGDLERLVNREGVEGALQALHRRGVYLTVDEFKGRRPAVRGSATISIDPGRLRNPRSLAHVRQESSASRGHGTALGIDLAFIREEIVNNVLALHARHGIGWLHASWRLPTGRLIVDLLRCSALGSLPVRSFSLVDPAAPGLHPRYRWSARAMRWGSLLAGVPLPRLRYVALESPVPIARWMWDVLRRGATPHLVTFTSPAVRLCRAALDAGLELRGAQLTVGGESLTAARLAVIRRAGAEVVPRYSSSESGLIGYGCLAPEAPDDVHVFHDFQALIQPQLGDGDGALPIGALLVTSLRPTAPLIMLNVSMGDTAAMVRRRCGCGLERLGWPTHLHTIRSYEKLTGQGMMFLDTDVIRVLEEVLPARFGGAPTDYQLLEEEADDGRPRLRLLVHPAIGPVDEEAVAETFRAAIGGGPPAARVMATLWREAGLPIVERRVPRATASGKILHLELGRRRSAGPSV